MFNNNSYLNNMQYNTQPYASYGYNGYGYQPQVAQPQQQIVQPQAQNNDIPFSEMHFGNLKEAEAYIVAPMKSVLFLNKAEGEIYVKSADNMGNPSFMTYKQIGTNKQSIEDKKPILDTKDFVKTDMLKDFVTKDDMKALDFKDDIDKINGKLSGVETKLERMNKLMTILGGKEDGKE